MTVTLSTNTDPNGTPRTHLILDRQCVVQYEGQKTRHRRKVWAKALTLYRKNTTATLRRWDGDAGILHTVAEK